MTAQPATLQDLADYLRVGYWASVGSGSPAIDVGADRIVTVNVTGLTDAGRALARAALEAWATVADLVFVEVTGPARITFDDSEAGAYTEWPTRWDGTRWVADAVVNVGLDWLADYGTSQRGYAALTYIHEVGHALGLGHAGPYNGSAGFDSQALFRNDSWQLSVMSYFDQDQNPYCEASVALCATPMMADVVAIQAIYGAATSGPTAGDTVWGRGSTLGTYLDGYFAGPRAGLADAAITIYDAGGRDRLDLSDDTARQRIDLAPGAFSSAYGEVGNIAIMAGTVIEDYAAGSGADLVLGNDAANALWLGAGADVARGGAGADTIRGGDGDDRIYGQGGADVLEGDGGADLLEGSGGSDVLRGGAGADRLVGGASADTLAGGADADVFVFLAAKDSPVGRPDLVEDFQRGVDDIDLRAIDARPGTPGDQAFVLDTDGVLAEGEIRQVVVDGRLELHLGLDADPQAEARIVLANVAAPLGAGDFLL